MNFSFTNMRKRENPKSFSHFLISENEKITTTFSLIAIRENQSLRISE